LYGTSRGYQIVRVLILNELLNHWESYADVIGGMDLDVYEYVCEMANDGKGGDHLTIFAAANVFSVEIALFSVFPQPLWFKPRSSGPTRNSLLLSGTHTQILQHKALYLCISNTEYYSLRPQLIQKVEGAQSLMFQSDSGRERSSSLSDDPEVFVPSRKRCNTLNRGPIETALPPLSERATLVDICVGVIGRHSHMLPPLEGVLPQDLVQRIIDYLVQHRTLTNPVLERVLDDSITCLDLSGSTLVTDETCDVIGIRCPSLQSLTLANCPVITKRGIQAIARKCPLLGRLDISHLTAIDDIAINELARRCTHLTSVNLSGCIGVTNAALAVLSAGCSSMQTLSLNGCTQLTDPVFELIGGLTRLDLSDCNQLTDSAVVQIASRTQSTLESIRLKGGSFTDSGVCRLATACGNLTELVLNDCEHVTFATIRSLSSCPSLRALSLKNCPNISGEGDHPSGPGLTPAGPMSTSLWSNMERIDLGMCINILDQVVLHVINRSPNLRKLDISSCSKITDDSVCGLSRSCRQLESLSVNNCVLLTNRSIFAVSVICPLVELRLHNCRFITDAALVSIARHCRMLGLLDVSWCDQLSDDGILQLRDGARNLRELSLEEVNIRPTTVSFLALRCSSLRSINLAYTQTDDEALFRLATGCPRLKSLDLTACNAVTSAGLSRALELLQELKSLKVRWLEGMQSMPLCHPKLENLDVSFCKYLTREGLLGTGTRCRGLVHVDLAWCTSLTVQDFHDLVLLLPLLKVINLRGFPPLPAHTQALLSSRGIVVLR